MLTLPISPRLFEPRAYNENAYTDWLAVNTSLNQSQSW